MIVERMSSDSKKLFFFLFFLCFCETNNYCVVPYFVGSLSGSYTCRNYFFLKCIYLYTRLENEVITCFLTFKTVFIILKWHKIVETKL